MRSIASDASSVPHVAIIGTNASGKSWLGVELASSIGTEVISADSRQVYQGFDLCSGKLTLQEMRGISHHLVNVVEPPTVFTLYDYYTLARQESERLCSRGMMPLLVGGTPLYVASLVRGYDFTGPSVVESRRRELETLSNEQLVSLLEGFFPGESHHVGLRNRRRLIRSVERAEQGFSYADVHRNQPFADWLVFGVSWEFEVLERRIGERLDNRLSAGMLDEIQDAIASGVPREFLYNLGLEYRFLLGRLEGQFATDAELREALFRAIRKFAKRQMSWFGKWPEVVWLEGSMEARRDQLLAEVSSALASRPFSDPL